MTRQVNDTNQIWYERQDQIVKIGFTKSFLEGMDQCWHILPANLERFKTKAPLLTVETNDALISILSPVAGNFMQYSDKAQNFPDKLTEEDVILELRDGPAVQRPVPAEPQAVRDGGAIVNRWNAEAAQIRGVGARAIVDEWVPPPVDQGLEALRRQMQEEQAAIRRQFGVNPARPRNF